MSYSKLFTLLCLIGVVFGQTRYFVDDDWLLGTHMPFPLEQCIQTFPDYEVKAESLVAAEPMFSVKANAKVTVMEAEYVYYECSDDGQTLTKYKWGSNVAGKLSGMDVFCRSLYTAEATQTSYSWSAMDSYGCAQLNSFNCSGSDSYFELAFFDDSNCRTNNEIMISYMATGVCVCDQTKDLYDVFDEVGSAVNISLANANFSAAINLTAIAGLLPTNVSICQFMGFVLNLTLFDNCSLATIMNFTAGMNISLTDILSLLNISLPEFNVSSIMNGMIPDIENQDLNSAIQFLCDNGSVSVNIYNDSMCSSSNLHGSGILADENCNEFATKAIDLGFTEIDISIAVEFSDCLNTSLPVTNSPTDEPTEMPTTAAPTSLSPTTAEPTILLDFAVHLDLSVSSKLFFAAYLLYSWLLH